MSIDDIGDADEAPNDARTNRPAADAVTPITSRNEFLAALRQGFSEAAQRGSRELWWCDEDFAEWPLGERATIELLTQWAASSRRLTLLARTFDEVPRRHARWVAWRQTWSHIVTCRTNTELEHGEIPALFIALGTVSVHLMDRVHHRGRLSHRKADEIQSKELFDSISQRSEEAFPATTTGL